MDTAKLFTNGRSQAVRLPKEYRFEGKEVNIRRTPEGVLLTPIRDRSMARLMAILEANETDVDWVREQPMEYEVREPFAPVKRRRK